MVKPRDFTANRSGGYQWVILESPQSPDSITECSDAQGMVGTINDGANGEVIHELQELLKSEYWNLIERELTSRQKEVIKLCAQGKTQVDIAKILNVNQSSVTKSLNGNVDYRHGKRVYGGAKKKLRRLAQKEPAIQAILKQIADLEDDL